MRPQKLMPRVFIGLGNPGKRYTRNRHNLGYQVLDEISYKYDLIDFKKHARVSGVFIKTNLRDQEIILFKPSKFMNESGHSVNQLIKFYKLKPEDICVIHDDLDIEPGNLQLKFGGGHAGHNGLRDIIKCCGSSDFTRIRIGIGHPSKGEVIDYVLKNPSQEDKDKIEASKPDAMESIEIILDRGLDEAMNHFNQ